MFSIRTPCAAFAAAMLLALSPVFATGCKGEEKPADTTTDFPCLNPSADKDVLTCRLFELSNIGYFPNRFSYQGARELEALVEDVGELRDKLESRVISSDDFDEKRASLDDSCQAISGWSCDDVVFKPLAEE